MRRTALIYVAGIAAGEVLVGMGALVAAVSVHAALLAGILNHVLWTRRMRASDGEVRSSTAAPIAPLALLPLLRILSLTMPARELDEVVWYALVGGPLLLAVGLMMRALDLPPHRIGLRAESWPLQLAVGSSGIPLGLALYAILRPEGLDLSSPWLAAGAAIVVFVFAGATEEIIFRGMVQSSLIGVLGPRAILVTAALFALSYAGSRSAELVVAAAVIGLTYGWVARRSGSIVGVMLAHGLVSAGLLVVWPRLL